jgi:hypothetical protein
MGAIKSGIGPYEGGRPSSGERVPGSPEVLSSPRSNPDQIVAPTDQVAGAFNAKVA